MQSHTFRKRFTRLVGNYQKVAGRISQRLPLSTATPFDELVEAVSDGARTAAAEIEAALLQCENSSGTVILEKLAYEFLLVEGAFKRRTFPKAASSALECGKTIIDSIKSILEKANDKLPFGPWLALQLLGEGFDFAKSLIPTMRPAEK